MLYINEQKKTAKEDILCYRLMLINKKSELMDFRADKYQQNINYQFPRDWVVEEYDSYYKKRNLIPIGLKFGKRLVLDGGYNSFDTLEMAKKFCYHMIPKNGSDIIITECIIPKGSEYYKGFHDSNYFNGYKSKNIIIKNVVEHWDENSLWVKEYDEKNETKREQHIKNLETRS